MSLRLTAALLLTVAGATGCASTQASQPSWQPDADPEWIQPSPSLQRQLEAQAARLSFAHSLEEKYELIRWFATTGEVAYPTLLRLAESGPNEEAQANALSCLASTADPRLLGPLAQLPFPGQDQPTLRLERARCHMVLGDWSWSTVLIDGLESPSLWSRALCARTLRDTTRMSFGFDPRKDPAHSADSIARWRAWDTARRADPLQVPAPAQ
jgi:hypothetical protein